MTRRGNNEGSIRQRGPRWEARVTLGYVGGKYTRVSFYGDTRGEAQRLLTQALRDQQQGLPVTDTRLTVASFLNRWLEDTHKPAVRPLTYRRDEQIVRLHLVPELGRVRLTKLTPDQVQRLLERQARGRALTRHLLAHPRGAAGGLEPRGALGTGVQKRGLPCPPTPDTEE